MSDDIDVDLLLIGAGPAGLFGAYYAGFRGLRTAVLDAQPQLGGQVSAIYPEKNIYDVAGLPAVRGQSLIDGLAEQAARFDPRYLLGQQAVKLERGGDERWTVTTDLGTRVNAGAVVITSGVGSVTPRPLPCDAEAFLDNGLRYFVPKLDVLDGKDVVVVGGGDSAVDWALAALPRSTSVTLVHRRQQFRAHEHSVQQLRSSSCRLVLDATVNAVLGDGAVSGVEVHAKGSEPEVLPAQVVVAALGFLMNLGPIKDWGLELDGRSIKVDSSMRTSLPGVFAAGDVTTYPGKVKLIAVGFGEVATAVNNAAVVIDPNSSLAPGHSSDAMPVAAV
ncbi:NAD(P)/FAD-dependent oxidoreductase [Pseudonocardia sp. WMMC193]|uniref:NAD(P)/FAD-dependent oxidoreductase n=1 Tax=Pseudonocardia sp. WMMC193 TaxID=2911965 RepID=UPI001F2F662C|nr:NAD(P)/FAD-dependent oxidoreductase [Pseudonocardia sp. WMMC193]MCF7550715.1 NAD(P)/FAD-dependent oxidoreductase [Pseudonocardia sp. WMMC193]